MAFFRRSLNNIASLAVVVVCLCGLPSRVHAFDLSDTEVKEEMARRSSLFCPGFSKDRGMPGINAVKVDALRVLISHKFTLCPDRRITDPVAAIWNSRWGVLLWNPTNPKSVTAMVKQADTFTHTLDFPNELMVYDLDGKPLKGQIGPMFQPRDTFTSF